MAASLAFPEGTAQPTLRALLESAPDAIVVVDSRGRIALVNAQTELLFGYRRKDLLGRSIEVLVPNRFADAHVRHRDQYAADPHVRPMGSWLELFGCRQDGSEFPVEIMLSPITIQAEKCVVSAIRDITDRKRFQQTLREKNAALHAANAAKDNFYAAMSHELRTPLNAILGFTGTLLMKLSGPLTTEQEQQLRIVQASARNLLSHINDILDISKVEGGRVDVHFEIVNVYDVVVDVAKGLRGLATDKELRFEVDVGSWPLIVRSDGRALQQILTNLGSNAIKYTERGFVRMDIRERHDDGRRWIDVRVVDSGVGIGTEDQQRIFKAFERVDASSTRATPGTGLGLYLSNELARNIGGRLSVHSKVGDGSVFTLSIPQA